MHLLLSRPMDQRPVFMRHDFKLANINMDDVRRAVDEAGECFQPPAQNALLRGVGYGKPEKAKFSSA